MDDVSTGTERRGQRVGEDVNVTPYRPAELLRVDPEARWSVTRHRLWGR